MSELVIASNKTLAAAHKNIMAQSTTIAMHGLDPEQFADVLVEALHANDKLSKADQNQLISCLRRACQDGVIPDGREGALIVNKHGDVSFQVMRDGWARIFHRAFPGSVLKSGYVREGQNVVVTTDTVKGDRVKVKTSFAGHDPKSRVIGSWCLIEVRGFKPFVHVFYEDDIAKARAATKTTSANSAWNTWTNRMAEKAVVKSAIRKALYMYPVEARLKKAVEESLDRDDAADLGETVIVADAEVVDAEVVEETKVETKKRIDPPKEKKKDPPKNGRRKENKKKPEPAKEPEKAKELEPVQEPVVEQEPDGAGDNDPWEDGLDFGIGDDFE